MRIREELFTVEGVPAVLWTPDDDTTWTPDDDTTGSRPLILIGHGGGQHKTAPGVLHRAHRFVTSGFAAVSVDVPNHGERSTDDRFQGIATEIQARVDSGDELAPLLAEPGPARRPAPGR